MSAYRNKKVRENIFREDTGSKKHLTKVVTSKGRICPDSIPKSFVDFVGYLAKLNLEANYIH